MQANQFNKAAFELAFNAALAKLAASEQTTKETLWALSRELLEVTHATGDIQYVNSVLGVLSAVNRKAAVVFFKHFTGFSYDEAMKRFIKKSKKRYEKAHKDSVEFLADPVNNIWSWAERHIEVEQKPFDMGLLNDRVKSILVKAENNGLTHGDVLRAMVKNGVTLADVLSILDTEFDVEVKTTEEPATTDNA